MATYKVIDKDSKEPLDLASVTVSNSIGLKLFSTLSTNEGDMKLPDKVLADKNGLVEITRVGYQKNFVLISDLADPVKMEKSSQTLPEVVVTAQRPKKKPERKVTPFWVYPAGIVIISIAAGYLISKKRA